MSPLYLRFTYYEIDLPNRNHRLAQCQTTITIGDSARANAQLHGCAAKAGQTEKKVFRKGAANHAGESARQNAGCMDDSGDGCAQASQEEKVIAPKRRGDWTSARRTNVRRAEKSGALPGSDGLVTFGRRARTEPARGRRGRRGGC